MPDKKTEPWTMASMDELLAFARAMEQEAIDGYVSLAARMRLENRPDLAAVFGRLIAEEEGHLGNVDRWLGGRTPLPVTLPEPLFDDEGAGLVAPELLTSYRAFSMAVRNEERAFVFWSYAAAHAPNDEIRHAAERLAMEELGHVATLRRERRRAFHAMRHADAQADKGNLPTLEQRLSSLLMKQADSVGALVAERLRAHSAEAAERAQHLSREPSAETPLLQHVPQNVTERLVPLCEFLLDCYLDLAERERTEAGRKRAQTFAGDMIRCLQGVRALPIP
ncbi:ferritin-like domain-containing protein [Sinorhizobium mexicanum]|uniref:Rubrerythrin family protein n=1 Tax=Sinorhizobium mexicanum TaxID=375549 RepID=A0A859QI11_9HYPH|nr:ferritin family protein [Sinorhizobium mexicanum]MBP1886044.1 rubrerythrin [Sinorhizobium mexicanum]QLL65332.1 rubrerythrin family protein [Sinorhizobium mexicanum]